MSIVGFMARNIIHAIEHPREATITPPPKAPKCNLPSYSAESPNGNRILDALHNDDILTTMQIHLKSQVPRTSVLKYVRVLELRGWVKTDRVGSAIVVRITPAGFRQYFRSLKK
jgi:DNA-binding MarR family transcriptional regulator